MAQSNTKRICVVGSGRWGKNHVKTLHALGCLGGIVDREASTLTALATEYPGCVTFTSLTDALAANFDGFVVATPAETHFDIAKALLEAKKDTLVEKPLCLTATDARELKRIAEMNGCNLMVGHVLLFHPAIRKIKELLDGGKLGKLQYLYSNRLNLGTVRTEENILWSFAPHDISIFQYLAASLPVEVVSRGGAFVQTHIHDSTMTILTYPNNVVGHIFVSWLHPFKEHRIVVVGTKGMLSYDDSSTDKQLLFYEKGVDWVQGAPVSRDGATEVIPYDKLMPLTEEVKYFIQSIDSRHVEVAGADNAVEVLEVLERASQSLASSSAVEVKTAVAPNLTTEERQPFYVHPSSYVDENVQIGEGTKIWHFSHIQPGSVIGRKCSIGQNVNIANNVRIGNFVKIQNNVSVYEGVELEDYVFCGPSMVFTNVLDPRCKYPQRGGEFYKKTLVKEGASIGANATVVCGHTIGKHAFIAAGAVVTSDVPDFALMMGVPARPKGWMCECGEQLGQVTREVTCNRCATPYALQGSALAQFPRKITIEKESRREPSMPPSSEKITHLGATSRKS